MHSPQWNRLFPDEDFRWSMSLSPGDATDFFAATSRSEETLALRRERITNQREHYVVIPSGANDLVVAALDFFEESTTHRFNSVIVAGAGLEPDWVLMRADESGRHRVEGGVVCFPSLWSLPEKAGLAIEAVHGPVPKLNESLAGWIDTFLARLGGPGVRSSPFPTRSHFANEAGIPSSERSSGAKPVPRDNTFHLPFPPLR